MVEQPTVARSGQAACPVRPTQRSAPVGRGHRRGAGAGCRPGVGAGRVSAPGRSGMRAVAGCRRLPPAFPAPLRHAAVPMAARARVITDGEDVRVRPDAARVSPSSVYAWERCPTTTPGSAAAGHTLALASRRPTWSAPRADCLATPWPDGARPGTRGPDRAREAGGYRLCSHHQKSSPTPPAPMP